MAKRRERRENVQKVVNAFGDIVDKRIHQTKAPKTNNDTHNIIVCSERLIDQLVQLETNSAPRKGEMFRRAGTEVKSNVRSRFQKVGYKTERRRA